MERLQEIETRLAAIKVELDAPDAILDELETEVRNLQMERTELQGKIEKRKAIVDGIITGEKTDILRDFGKEERKMDLMDRDEILASPEYRSAFFKTLQGKPLNEVEQRSYTNASGSAGAAIPTQTATQLFEKMVQLAPMLSEVTLLRIAGNVNIAIEGVRDDAAIHTQNAVMTSASDTITYVTLTGYEFNKVISISKTVQTMAIGAFESWITGILAEDISRIVEYYLINGSGSSQPQGVSYANATWTTTYEISSTSSITYDNVMDLIALLPAAYDAKAKFLCNKKFVYNQLAVIKEATTNAPILVKDMEAGLRFVLMGYPVVISDKVVDGEMYLGDYTKLVANLAQDITVESSAESGFLRNAIDYRGGVVFDSKVGNSDAFVRFKKN